MGTDRTTTYLTPPKLARFPIVGGSLEYATRSMVPTADGRGIWRAWGPPGSPWPLRVEPDGARWRVDAVGVSPPGARAAARALFSLDHPIEEFYRLVRREPILRGTERRFRGLRLPRDASLFESLVTAIIGQQLSVQVAATLDGRLRAATEAYIRVDGLKLPTVPSPDRLRRLGFAGLRQLGLSRAKSKALLAIAEGEREGRFATPLIQAMGAEEAIEWLDREPGVGRWTAENALLRGVGRTDMFVAGDLGLRVALANYGALPRAAPEEEARAWAQAHYPGWGSYATLYLWRKLTSDRRAKSAV